MECPVGHLRYGPLRQLLLDISDGKSPSTSDRSHLKQMIIDWANADCPDDGCDRVYCPFLRPEG